MKKILFIILLLISLIIIPALAYVNSAVVEVNYFIGKMQLPWSWVTVGAFLSGILLSLLFFALTGWGWKLKAKSLEKKLNELLKNREREAIADRFSNDNNAQ